MCDWNRLSFITLCWLPGSLFAGSTDVAKPLAVNVGSNNLMNWSLGLFIVLCVFFLCVWGLRKVSNLSMNGTEPMRIVGGISLGMREKVVLVQVGKKQLILGVTPGRIQTLHVLEPEDCLSRETSSGGSAGFAQKLIQAMKGQSNA
jgi:flagellar protein FliO/FliZ